MSAVLVVLDLRNGKLDEAVFGRMLRTIDNRGPDGCGGWVHGPAGLGHQSLAVTREDADEPQPVVIEPFVGVFDGRLDNRAELIDMLLPAPPGDRSVGDAELVVRAYAEWGDDCASHLLGDFGFAVWDSRRRRLFCARDRVGVRPLFYWQRGQNLVVSTDVRGVLAHPRLSKQPNEAQVAHLLANRFRDRRETLYAGVLRVPPAHTLTVESGRLSLERYWDVEVDRGTSTLDKVGYVDTLVALLSDAISCRLRARSAPTISLSGGLDSSLITALAVDSVRSSPSSPPGVTATSVVYPGLSCDESDYIGDVVGVLGLPSRRIFWVPRDWEGICAEAARSAYVPPQPNAALGMFVRDGLRRTVVIKGSGGDQWMKGSPAHFVDLIRGWRFRELSTLVREGAGLRLARVVLQAVRARTTDRVRHPRARESVPWFGPALRQHIARHVEPDVSPPSGVAKSIQARYRALHAPSAAYNFEVTDQDAAGGHLAVANPFYDVRLVQFAFDVPEVERWRGSDRRWLERRALVGRVPDRVALRRRAAEFSATFEAQFQMLDLAALFAASRLHEFGWIRADDLLLAAHAQKPSQRASARQVWFALAVEAWVRTAWG
jgi:asparagine synthase (glutamine-hydrolysing)